MTPKAGFLSLAEELRFYILSFLPCRDILRCTSVCKAFRQTYMSSSELQYTIELSGQRLLPVPNMHDHSPISKRLQLLRDKAHAWFRIDTQSFETITLPIELCVDEMFIVNGHLYFWDADEDYEDSATIIPILPKPSQQTFKREWPPGTLCSIPNSTNIDVFMDPAQNLFAIVYAVPDGPLQSDEKFYIDLRALKDDSVHPKAAGRTLFLSELPGYKNRTETKSATLKGFGRHVALGRRLCVVPGASSDEIWQLQIWDWQHSTTSNSILSDTNPRNIDFSFLGNDRFLVVNVNLKLYSIEDMYQAPQLLACFLMPLSLKLQCLLSMDDIDQMEGQQTMYTSDPTHRILCLVACYPHTQVFIVSTSIFFDLDKTAAETPIPWNRWGPSNTRVFEPRHQCKVQVSGTRVLMTFPFGMRHAEYVLHVMDFSPLAVTNRRGLGRAVNEPSTIVTSDITGRPGDNLTTSLPYVDVILNGRFGSVDSQLHKVWIDKDRIYLFKIDVGHVMAGSTLGLVVQSTRLDVIDV